MPTYSKIVFYVFLFTLFNFIITETLTLTADAGSDITISTSIDVNLDGSQSILADSYSWTFSSKPFGSQSILYDSNSAYLCFTPDVAGSYVVLLTVHKDSSSDTDTVTVNFNPIPAVLTADAGSDITISTSIDVNLDGSQSILADSYSWTFSSKPFGSQSILYDSNRAYLCFTPDVAGSYVVLLTVHKDSSSDTDTVTVNFNPIPTANAETVNNFPIITLDGSNSNNGLSGENPPLTYLWSIVTKPNGSNIVLSSTTAESPTFTPDQDGCYEFSLVVNNGFNDSAADIVDITITIPEGFCPLLNETFDFNINVYSYKGTKLTLFKYLDKEEQLLLTKPTQIIIEEAVSKGKVYANNGRDIVYKSFSDFTGCDSMHFKLTNGSYTTKSYRILINIIQYIPKSELRKSLCSCSNLNVLNEF